MATRTTRPTTTPNADEHVLVRLADASHFDQWCVSDELVFTRGEPSVSLPHAEAERIVAAAAGSLVLEESA